MKYLLSLFLLIGWAAARGQSGYDVNKPVAYLANSSWKLYPIYLEGSLESRVSVLEKQVAYLVRRTIELEAEIKALSGVKEDTTKREKTMGNTEFGRNPLQQNTTGQNN